MPEFLEDGIPIGGLLSPEELDAMQVIKPEFTAPTFHPKITLNYNDLTFSASCVRLFPETEYVQLLVDDRKRRMVVLPCGQYDVGSVKWSSHKKGKLSSRNIRAKIASAKIFRMMDWDITYRYKVMAIYQKLNSLKLAVFNFADCTMLVPEDITDKDGNMKTRRRMVIALDWEKLFGPTYGEHRKQYEVDIQTYHLISDQMTEGKPPMVPRVPTPEEIMTRNYYVPDELEKGGTSDGKT
jgi:hypothetical protein